jgi:tetratricopeptide (TPR) repeat protein
MPVRLPHSRIIASATLLLLGLTGAATSPAIPPDPTPAAQSGTDSSYLQQKVKEWRTAAVQHTPGKPDQAAAMIGSWATYDLEAVLKFIAKLASQPASAIKRAKAPIRRLLDLTEQEAKQGDLSRILKQGALLHTDIALLELEKGDYQHKPEGIEATGLFADGRVVLQPQQRSWQFAGQLIDLIPRSQPQDDLARQWYIATTAHMQSRRLLGYAGQNLKRGLKRFPSDNKLLFYAGVLHETWASPVNQSPELPRGASVSYGSRNSELRLARHYFEKALEKYPGFAEARLRLGRVTGLQGNHRKAIAELQNAAAVITDPQLSYYASLFLGYEFTMVVRGQEAREQYERAAMLYPTAQSPLLAISQLALDNGDTEGALRALQLVFGLRIKDRWNDDPWWVYDLAHVRDAAALVAEMQKKLGEFQP